MVKIVPVSGRHLAFVDDKDYERVAQHNWFFERGYAKSNNRREERWMHRFILQPLLGQAVDHANGNGLDNRRSNIRIATPAQNAQNTKAKEKNWLGGIPASEYRGVFRDKSSKVHKWAAQIRADGQRFYLGRFVSEKEAAKAYDNAARKLHGVFARLNFLDD